MKPGEGEALVRRYLDDRDSLSDGETAALVRWLEEDPDRVADLRSDLVLDELLSQRHAVDRKDFPAQVRQRVSDWLAGEQALDERAAELRALAAGQLQEYAKRGASRRWIGWALAVAALLGIVAATPLVWSAWNPTVARVETVEGEAFVSEGDDSRSLQPGDELRSSDRIGVEKGGSVELVYADQTRVALEGEAVATIADKPFGGAKRIRLDSGALVAAVAPQPAGAPMTFETPHSEVRVLGTELLIDVTRESTRLEVRHGRVEFRRTLPPKGSEPQSVIVKTDQSGVSAAAGLALEEGLWPTRRLGLAFLYAASAAGVSFDDPTTGNARTSSVTGEGRAWIDPLYRMHLAGGRFVASPEDSRATAESLSKSCAFSLETTLLLARPTEEEVSLVRLGAPRAGEENFAFDLRLRGTTVSLALTRKPTGGGPNAPPQVERELGESPAGEPAHWIVTYAQGRLHAYRDGALVLQEQLEPADVLSVPDGAELTMGPASERAGSFEGLLEAVAIYDRELDPREARRNSLELRRARSLRPAIPATPLRFEPVDDATFDRAWDERPAKLAEPTLVFVDVRRSDVPPGRSPYVSLATIVDPRLPGEKDRIRQALSSGDLSGLPLTEMPDLDRLPRGDLRLPASEAAAIGVGSQYFIDGFSTAETAASAK